MITSILGSSKDPSMGEWVSTHTYSVPVSVEDRASLKGVPYDLPLPVKYDQVPYTAGRLFIFWASREVVFGFFYCS